MDEKTTRYLLRKEIREAINKTSKKCMKHPFPGDMNVLLSAVLHSTMDAAVESCTMSGLDDLETRTLCDATLKGIYHDRRVKDAPWRKKVSMQWKIWRKKAKDWWRAFIRDGREFFAPGKEARQ